MDRDGDGVRGPFGDTALDSEMLPRICAIQECPKDVLGRSASLSSLGLAARLPSWCGVLPSGKALGNERIQEALREDHGVYHRICAGDGGCLEPPDS